MNETSFRRLTVGLLLANTFLVCALAGAGAVYLSGRDAVLPSRMPLAGEQLPGDVRAAFQKALSDARREVRLTVQEARQARVEAAALMGKPVLDAQALSDALERARDAEMAVRAATEKRAVEFAQNLSLEERRRLADGLVQREAPRPATK
jgi:uncharacterized membrane protein